MQIEMSATSTLRDMQLFMFAHEINLPIHVILSQRHCYASNEDNYRSPPVTIWVTKSAHQGGVVILKAPVRDAGHVT